MVMFAWRNLIHDRTRLLISAGGVALSIVLVLVLNGIFLGGEQAAVGYIRNQPADIWLMQAGVENIHMASSILPSDAVQRVRRIPGVEAAVGVLYATVAVEVGDTLVPSYLFGIDPASAFGGPWSLAAGTSALGLTDVVVDETLARRYGLGVGDSIRILGYSLKIAGLSRETFGLATNIVFANKTAVALAMGVSPQAASYILVRQAGSVDSDRLTEALRRAAPEANVLNRDEFVLKERDLIRQMGTDVILAMSVVAYAIGLLVIGLTIFTATVERAREYAVLKAIGATNGRLVGVVFQQAYLAAGLGVLLGVALAYGLAALVGRLLPEVMIVLDAETGLRQLPAIVVVVALAAILPLGRVLRADPLVVFQS